MIDIKSDFSITSNWIVLSTSTWSRCCRDNTNDNWKYRKHILVKQCYHEDQMWIQIIIHQHLYNRFAILQSQDVYIKIYMMTTKSSCQQNWDILLAGPKACNFKVNLLYWKWCPIGGHQVFEQEEQSRLLYSFIVVKYSVHVEFHSLLSLLFLCLRVQCRFLDCVWQLSQ